MSRIDVKKRNIGINFTNNVADVSIWSPLAKTLEIKIGGKSIPLNKSEYGYWNLQTDKILPGTKYKLWINHQQELPDPASLFQPEGVHGCSEAVDLEFNWTDSQWKNYPLEQYIIYELHAGTFTREGNFKGIESKIDYLSDLGITAIEIMPVAQFAGSRNWGYDGVYPFAVQNSYGGNKELQQLVNTCHNKGLAVILDVVYNHLGPEGNYLPLYGPYFTSKYNTPWGEAVNFDDEWCFGTRDYYIENALMWLRDFHIDALRLDAVHAIKDFSPIHFLKELNKYVEQLQEYTGRNYHLIVESDLNDPKFINNATQCGFGMGAQWIDEFHHALRVSVGEKKDGYYCDFNGVEDLSKSYKDAYVYDGQYSPHRHKFFGLKTSNPGDQFVVFSQNHDQVGNRMLGERSSHLYSFELQKLMAAAVLLSPFIPMLFMGEEWSASSPFLYFVSHTDKKLAEAVTDGRKKEFSAFRNQGDPPDPVAEETFINSKLNWDELWKDPHKQMLGFYKHLIQIRKQHPALSNPDRQSIEVSCLTKHNTIIMRRKSGYESVTILFNFSNVKQLIHIPGIKGLPEVLISSTEKKWNGDGSKLETTGDGKFLVPKEAAIVINNH
jgi:maltooligosyltrehalose trehalohydrolase